MGVANKETSEGVINIPEVYGFSTIRQVENTVYEMLEKGCTQIVADFSDTKLLESSGIGSLVTLSRTLKSKNIPFTLRHLCEEIRDLFIDTDLDKMFTMGAFIGDRMVGKGKGSSKQIAEQVAAEDALKRLKW